MEDSQLSSSSDTLSKIEQQGIKPVPKQLRKETSLAIFLTFLGIFSHLLMFVLGADMGKTLGIITTILVLIISVLLVAPMFILGGWIGVDHGIPGSVAMRIVFGIRGSWLPSLMNSIVAMGWFALQTSISALAFDKIMMYFGMASHYKLWILIWGIIYCINAVIGYGWISLFAKFAVPVLYCMFVFMSVKIGQLYGFKEALKNLPCFSAFTFLYSVDAIFGGYAGSGTTLLADYTRYAKYKSAPFAACFAAMIAGSVIIFLGAIATFYSKKADITATMLFLGMGLVAMFVVLFATWTTNPCNTYSASLSMANVTGWNRNLCVILLGVLGVGLAVWGILEHFIEFLSLIGIIYAPMNSVLFVEYFLNNDQKIDTEQLFRENDSKYWFFKGWNIKAFGAWLVSVAVILIFKYGIKASWMPVPALVSCILAGVIYYAVSKVYNKENL
ncbi:MAG: cytosine permease [bacterium]